MKIVALNICINYAGITASFVQNAIQKSHHGKRHAIDSSALPADTKQASQQEQFSRKQEHLYSFGLKQPST